MNNNNIADLAVPPNDGRLNVDNTNQSALLLAAENGRLEDLIGLLNNGVNIESMGRNNQTALHLAASNGQVATVRELLDNGASIDVRSTYNQTPLHLAASNGHVATVRELLNRRADTGALDGNNQTPRQLADQYNHTEAMGVLQAVEDELVDAENLNQFRDAHPGINAFLNHRYPQMNHNRAVVNPNPPLPNGGVVGERPLRRRRV